MRQADAVSQFNVRAFGRALETIALAVRHVRDGAGIDFEDVEAKPLYLRDEWHEVRVPVMGPVGVIDSDLVHEVFGLRILVEGSSRKYCSTVGKQQRRRESK